jgi:hypothetical protein
MASRCHFFGMTVTGSGVDLQFGDSFSGADDELFQDDLQCSQLLPAFSGQRQNLDSPRNKSSFDGIFCCYAVAPHGLQYQLANLRTYGEHDGSSTTLTLHGYFFKRLTGRVINCKKSGQGKRWLAPLRTRVRLGKFSDSGRMCEVSDLPLWHSHTLNVYGFQAS